MATFDYDPDELNAAVPFQPRQARDPRRQAMQQPRQQAVARDPRAPLATSIQTAQQPSPLAGAVRPDQTRATQDRRNAEREARQNAAASAPSPAAPPRAGPTGAVDFNRYMATNQSAARAAGQRAAQATQDRGNAARQALDQVYRNWLQSGAQGTFEAPQSVMDQYARAQDAMRDPLAGASWFDRGLSGRAAAGEIGLAQRTGERMSGDLQRTRDEAAAFERRRVEQAAGEAAAIEASRQAARQSWNATEDALAENQRTREARDAADSTRNMSPEAYYAMFGEWPEGYEEGW